MRLELLADARGDVQRALEVEPVPGGGVRAQQRLHRVHVRVRAPVGVHLQRLGRAGIDDHPGVVVPPQALEGLQSRLQQLAGARHLGQKRGCGGQDDEAVVVGDERARHGRPLQGDPRPPRPGLPVVQRPVEQGGDAVLREGEAVWALRALRASCAFRAFGTSGLPEQVPQREAVGHPPGDPQLDSAGGVHGAVVGEPAESSRDSRALPEAQEPAGLGVEERAGRSTGHESSLTRCLSRCAAPGVRTLTELSARALPSAPLGTVLVMR